MTFFLITYNQEDYVREAVMGAFSQGYSPLEIVLSDDHSTDRTFEIMAGLVREYVGPHEVILNRNERNLGLCGNVNRLFDLSSGSIVVIAGGDDISYPNRVENSVKLLSEHPEAMCVSLGLRRIDARGLPIPAEGRSPEPDEDGCDERNLNDLLSAPFHHSGASRAFRRSVFEFFGPLGEDSETEDSTTLLRCLLLGTSCESRVPGVQYRIHGKNYSMFEQGLRIDRRRIFDQYMRDTDKAVAAGLIESSDGAALRSVLLARLRASQFEKGYVSARFKVVHVARHVMNLGTREAVRYARRSIKDDLRMVLRALSERNAR